MVVPVHFEPDAETASNEEKGHEALVELLVDHFTLGKMNTFERHHNLHHHVGEFLVLESVTGMLLTIFLVEVKSLGKCSQKIFKQEIAIEINLALFRQLIPYFKIFVFLEG